MHKSCLIVSSVCSVPRTNKALWKRCSQYVALARNAKWPVLHIVPPRFDEDRSLDLAVRARREEPILTPPRCGRFEWSNLAIHLRAAPLERVEIAGHFDPADLLTVLVQCNANRLAVRARPDSFATNLDEAALKSVISFLTDAADFAIVDTPLSIAAGA